MTTSILVYNFLLLMLFSSWKLLQLAGHHERHLRFAPYLLCAAATTVIYSAIIGLRYRIGLDFEGYEYYFDVAGPASTSDSVGYESGLYYLIRLIRQFTHERWPVFFFMAAIQISFMSAWLYRHWFIGHWLFFFYFSTLLFFDSLNITRQSMALSILMLAVHFAGQRRPLPYIALTVLAAQFHGSAWMFLPLYLLLNRNRLPTWRWLVVILFFCYALGELISDQIFSYLPVISVLLGYENYGRVQSDLFFEGDPGGISPGLIIFLLIDLWIIYNARTVATTFRSTSYNSYFTLFFIGACLTPIVLQANYIPFARIVFYFTAFKMVCLAFTVHYSLAQSQNRSSQLAASILIVVYFAWWWLQMFTGPDWTQGFRFIWQV